MIKRTQSHDEKLSDKAKYLDSCDIQIHRFKLDEINVETLGKLDSYVILDELSECISKITKEASFTNSNWKNANFIDYKQWLDVIEKVSGEQN